MPYSKPNTDDLRILEINELAPPAHLLREFPASDLAAQTTFAGAAGRASRAARCRRPIAGRHRPVFDPRCRGRAGVCPGDCMTCCRDSTRICSSSCACTSKSRVQTVGWKGLINDPRMGQQLPHQRRAAPGAFAAARESTRWGCPARPSFSTPSPRNTRPT